MIYLPISTLVDFASEFFHHIQRNDKNQIWKKVLFSWRMCAHTLIEHTNREQIFD